MGVARTLPPSPPPSPARRRAVFRLIRLAGLAGLTGYWEVAAAVAAEREVTDRRVTDMAGRVVRLPGRITRLASAGGSPAVNAFLFLFGRGEQIINGLPSAFQGRDWDWQRRFAPGLQDKPAVSGPPPAWTPNLEALLRLAPDVSFVASPEAARLLERAGLCAVVLQWDRPEHITETVQLLGRIFQQEAQAAAWLHWQGAVNAAAARCLPDFSTRPRPRVLYASWQNLSQPILTTANHLIHLAGGESVTARNIPPGLDSVVFSPEQVLAWNPAFIFLSRGADREKVLADPRFQQVEAVRKGQVFGVPHGAHLWTHYTPEQALGVLWAARLLHGGACAALDVQGEAAGFYERFYGARLGPEELARLLANA